MVDLDMMNILSGVAPAPTEDDLDEDASNEEKAIKPQKARAVARKKSGAKNQGLKSVNPGLSNKTSSKQALTKVVNLSSNDQAAAAVLPILDKSISDQSTPTNPPEHTLSIQVQAESVNRTSESLLRL